MWHQTAVFTVKMQLNVSENPASLAQQGKLDQPRHPKIHRETSKIMT
jgi:hypothetical protein